MKFLKLILTTSLLLSATNSVFAADQWTPTKPQSSDAPTNWPADEQANNNSISRILANYRRGEAVAYTSSTSVTVSAGEVSCNSTTPIVLRQNTSSSALTSANLDTGVSFNNSTTYYVYAVCDANATTNTFFISSNASAPAGATNYRKIGSFLTNSSAAILPATVNSEPSGPMMADTSGNATIQGIFDYGSSASASTFKTGSLKIAYGSISVGASSSQGITNLPFTSSSSYQCFAGNANASSTQNENTSCVTSSGSALTVYNVWPSGSTTIDWFAIGT